MIKKLNVDVEKSIDWNAANGRLAPAPKEEYAHIGKHKVFKCPSCNTEHDISSTTFGEKVICPKCGTGMQEKF